jgi:outer membrane protein OmpA-like peptidoglycan-associated protein
MPRLARLLVLTATLSCATERAAAPDPAPLREVAVLRSAELARVRCLLVAPLENGSDAPLSAEAATGALVANVDGARTKVLPIADLRGIFRETPLELPAGMGPSLALELAGLVGADAALYGSVDGRSRDTSPELLVTIRLSLAGNHELLYARTLAVTPATAERADAAVRRAVAEATRPVLAQLGDGGKRRCFDPERTRALRRLALAETDRGHPAAAALPAQPVIAAARPAPVIAAPVVAAPVVAAPAAAPAPPRAIAKTPRQVEWARKLEAGERFVIEEVGFAGRSADLQRDAGLADLAAAVAAAQVAVRLEGFVDATSDHGADQGLSARMAQAAGKRLVELGTPRPRVSSAGRGGESPLLPNFTARGRAANRRVEAVGAR